MKWKSGISLVSVLVMLTVSMLWPGPVATGPEVRAFLGGRTGKLVFVNEWNWKLHYIDFSDSILVERKIADDVGVNSPMIHPEGDRVLYESRGSVYIREIVENSTVRHLIADGGAREPHWWKHPGTGEEYVTYTVGTPNNVTWPPQEGVTYIQKIEKDRPVGERMLFVPFIMSGGRSKDGRWASTALNLVGMYELHPDKVQYAFKNHKNWLEENFESGCNASTNPSPDPIRQDMMMHLTTGFTDSRTGKSFGNHEAVVIRRWTDPGVNEPFWYMGIPGVRCNDDGSGNIFWSYNEWSTEEDYFSATGSKIVWNWDQADLYLVHIGWEGDSRILRVVEGDEGVSDYNIYSHLWVQNGVLPARPRLDQASLEFAASLRDSAELEPKVVSITNSGDVPLPELTLQHSSSWLDLELRDNGTDTPSIVHRIIRDSAGAGVQVDTVRVSYGTGSYEVSYFVTFTLEEPVLSAWHLQQSVHFLSPRDSLHLQALGLDQTGVPLDSQPIPIWFSMDSLKSNSSLVVPDTFFTGPQRFIGLNGEVKCTLEVWVPSILYRFDLGKATTGSIASGKEDPWPSPDTLLSGFPMPQRSDTLRLPAMHRGLAPDTVLATHFSQPFAIELPSLPAGEYGIRLHLVRRLTDSLGSLAFVAEQRTVSQKLATVFSDSTDARIFEIAISVTDADGLGLTVSRVEGVGVAALEVYHRGPAALQLTSPNGDGRYHWGDTLPIRWMADTARINSVNLQLSVDSGATWHPINQDGAIGLGESWGAFDWVLPDSIEGEPLDCDHCLLMVYDYFGSDQDHSDRVFGISAGQSTGLGKAPSGAPALSLRSIAGTLYLTWGGHSSGEARLLDARGRQIADFTLRQAMGGIDLSALPKGLYRVQVQAGKNKASASFLHLDD